jgi:hypothetical protein
MLATLGFGLKDSYKKEEPLILGLINIFKNRNHQFQVWVKFYWLAKKNSQLITLIGLSKRGKIIETLDTSQIEIFTFKVKEDSCLFTMGVTKNLKIKIIIRQNTIQPRKKLPLWEDGAEDRSTIIYLTKVQSPNNDMQ